MNIEYFISGVDPRVVLNFLIMTTREVKKGIRVVSGRSADQAVVRREGGL